MFLWIAGFAILITLGQTIAGPVPNSAPDDTNETTAGWTKSDGNPVLGGKYGTCFDISVLKEANTYRMWVSWRPQKSIALVESQDGTHWSEPPKIVLPPKEDTSW